MDNRTWVAFSIFHFLLSPFAMQSAWAYLTDKEIHTPPAPAALPAAGGTWLDPVFGSRLMRVTDENDGPGCGTNYSYWPTFNKDSTWLLTGCSADGDTVYLYRFDKANFRLTSKRLVTLTNTFGVPLGIGVWSGVDPHVIYSHKGRELYSYNVETQVVTLVKDFSTYYPEIYLFQMHRSMDDNRFSFTRKLAQEPNYPVQGYIVWDRAQDQLVVDEVMGNINEVQLDKSGRYLVVKLEPPGGVGILEGRILDIETKIFTDLTDSPDLNLMHSDNGIGTQVGEENWEGGIWLRDLADPRPRRFLMTAGPSGGHYSMLADDESWVLASSHGGIGNFGVELFMVATDGSQRVKRLAHHQSLYRGYNDSPRPNISRDGRFVAFSSNWGGRSRGDLFVLQVDPADPLRALLVPNLNSVKVYPNPWRKDRHVGLDMTFDGWSGDATLKIFTLSGYLVRELSGSGTITWDRKNMSGDAVASGLYIFLMKDAQGDEKRGKLAIVK